MGSMGFGDIQGMMNRLMEGAAMQTQERTKRHSHNAFAEYLETELEKIPALPWYRPFAKKGRAHNAEWAVRFARVGIVSRAIKCAVDAGINADEVFAVSALLFPNHDFNRLRDELSPATPYLGR